MWRIQRHVEPACSAGLKVSWEPNRLAIKNGLARCPKKGGDKLHFSNKNGQIFRFGRNNRSQPSPRHSARDAVRPGSTGRCVYGSVSDLLRPNLKIWINFQLFGGA